ncbi:MAG: DedA family protein, partial [Gemmatimonadota bacterium]|nr:DedA family protein [Gemmatimonadota bacterium]MEC9317196.1 DedA family protein [Gemmatimonadota bacterium]
MTETVRKAGPLRRLYDWVLHWAETPYGAPALFVLALAESSFFPI